jgi:hypothetical protein
MAVLGTLTLAEVMDMAEGLARAEARLAQGLTDWPGRWDQPGQVQVQMEVIQRLVRATREIQHRLNEADVAGAGWLVEKEEASQVAESVAA